jgi:hypothetical protein
MSKQAIIAALYKFINQRSGIDFANYGEREYFMGDYRPILKYGRHARQLLQAVALRDSISAESLLKATSAYSGRLQIVERDDKVECDYCTGQYFPTEYRKAACAVLARALWDYWAPDCKDGHAIRQMARRELGRGIASVWFN